MARTTPPGRQHAGENWGSLREIMEKFDSYRKAQSRYPRDSAGKWEQVLTPSLDTSLRHDSGSHEQTLFVAICPRTPLASVPLDNSWTALSVQGANGDWRAQGNCEESTVWFPARSFLTQSFLRQLEALDPHQSFRSPSSTVEIRVVGVQPLSLDTLYITVEKGLLESVDAAQREFGGGFDGRQPTSIGAAGGPRKNKTNGVHKNYWHNVGSTHDRLVRVLREAVQAPPIIHTGDALVIPLPSHPITHNPPPPAVISACEPVSQGLISPATRIVLVQSGSGPPKIASRAAPKMVARQNGEDDGEDTSNEQFYSAREDGEYEDDSEEEESEDDELSEKANSASSSPLESESASDDSLENMISLEAPDLHSRRSALLSETGTTPRPGGKTYVNSCTPGSLHSNFTAMTGHPGPPPGKFCRAEALLVHIPNEALHPKPAEDDDGHCFIFVHMSTLTKIGCFSGDWVRLGVCDRPDRISMNSFSHGTAGTPTDDSSHWRAVRVFGLSNQAARGLRYALGHDESRTSSASSPPRTAVAYIPPVLLWNVGAPSFVRLSALHRRESRDVHSLAKPPLAKEITLSKVATPFSTKKEAQSSLFTAVKDHFQSSLRVLKEGDLIAVAIDEEIGRIALNAGQPGESGTADLIAAQLGSSSSGKNGRSSVVWFTVAQVVRDSNISEHDENPESVWGGTVSVDSSTTRMAQAGNCLRGIPATLARNAAIWLGANKASRRATFASTQFNLWGHTSESSISPLQNRLTDLIRVATSPRAISLGMPPLVILLHSTQRQVGKSYLASSACTAAGTHLFTIVAHDVLADAGSPNGGGDAKTEIILKTMAERASSCGSQYTALLITHLEALSADRMVGILSELISDSRVVIATTTELEKVSDGVRSLFTHELELTAPDESAREVILHNACMQLSLKLDNSVDLKSVALKTAALVAGDLIDVVHRASLAHDRRLTALATVQGVSESDVFYAGGPSVSNIIAEDFDEAIRRARSSFSDSIGAPKIPSVTWDDVGGLADQKSSIMETISLPLTRPELFARGIRKRSGILFYGPPGTGKTLLAKAIATEFSLNFFSVKGPELLNMYIGESEANVRRVFQRARDARPCVVFFDELDSVAPKRGNQGDSGGVMDRIVSQLLAELDGMSSSSSSDKAVDGDASGNVGGVFVIGATNRPDLLDPALLRPGRFDKMLYLGVSSTHEQQVPILKALTRQFTLAPKVDLIRVAAQLPLTYTGADLYALCSDAMLKAITRKTKQVDIQVRDASRTRGQNTSTAFYFDHLATPDDITVVVGEEDFAAAQRELNASVSAKELAHFERIRSQFEQQDLSSSKGVAQSPGTQEAPGLTTWASLPRRAPNDPKARSSKTRQIRNDESTIIQGKGKGKSMANPDSGLDDIEIKR